MATEVSSQDLIKNILRRWSDGAAGALTGSTRPIVTNDLTEAAIVLSTSTWQALPGILSWMRDELDPDCYGSPEKVQAWAARHEH